MAKDKTTKSVKKTAKKAKEVKEKVQETEETKEAKTAEEKSMGAHFASVEEHVDQKLGAVMKKYRFVDKIMKNKLVKDFLGSQYMETINGWVSPYRDTLVKVLAFLAFLFGGLSLVGLLFTGALVVMAPGAFVFLAIGLLGALLTLSQGYGMWTRKKWLPTLTVCNVAVGVVLSLLSFVPFFMMANTNVLTALLQIAISVTILGLILKHKSYFNQ